MGVLGDIIREARDLAEFSYNECGGKDVVDEIKDIIKAMKGK